MKINLDFSKKSFAIYGLGSTGKSIIEFFKKKKIKNYVIWDDSPKLKKKWGLNKKKEKKFSKLINYVDYIIMSPGIKQKNALFKKALNENKNKIISDIDLFYMFNSKMRSIVVTGTNGKSTTCKIIEHVLRKSGIKVSLGGNIGKPIMSLKIVENQFVIIEASSFQLEYSKFIKPHYALILNITNDHLEWHGSMKKYTNSKFKIFSYQNNNNYAFISSKKLLKKYNSEKNLANLKIVKPLYFSQIKNKIKNNYINSKINEQNMNFVTTLLKVLGISQKKMINSLNTFKGLPHRYEIFLKKKNLIFINDSKATSFQSTKFALQSNKNIFWILGGLPKLGDKFNIGKLKKNIVKTYIIGKHMNNFKKLLSKKVNYKLVGSLKNAVPLIFKDLQKVRNKKITILFSPASASYDQFKNFEERGNKFKNLIKKYAAKYN